MSKFLLVCLVFTVSLLHGFGQESIQVRKDSLLTIAQSGFSTEAAMAYKQLAMMTYRDSFDLHLYYSDQGLTVASRINDRQSEANILMNLGVSHDIKGMFDQAIVFYDSAQAIFLQLENVDDWLCSLYINYGAAYYFAGNKSVSLDYWLRAYEKSFKDTTDVNYGVILNNIANIYEELGKHEDAINYYEESLSLKEARNDQAGYLNTLKNLGRAYIFTGDSDNALKYLKEAEEGYRDLASNSDVAPVLMYKAKALLTIGRLIEAEKIIIPLARDTFQNLRVSQRIEGLIICGDLMMAQSKPMAGIRYYSLAKQFVDQTSITSEKASLLKKLAACYFQIKDNDAAYQLLNSSYEAILSETSKHRLQLEQEMQVKFNTLQKEQENTRLLNESMIKDLRIKNTRRGLWIVLAFLGVVTFIAIQNYLIRKKIQNLNRILSEQKKLISRSLAEKEILLKEIHHRVKNNLQVVSSLLGIQSRQVKDKAALEAIKEGRARVHSMSLIHQDLYKKDHPTGIELRSYFDKLSHDLLDTYDISSDKIQLTSDIDNIILDVDTVIPLGLILNELITNALKYAFPAGKGSIHVKIKEKEQGLLLQVKDDGIGIKNPEKIEHGDSFGYDLIQSFMLNMEGELKVLSEKGTEVSILLREYEKAA